MPADEGFAQRTAQEGPGNQAEGGGRHGDGGSALQAHLFQQRREAPGRTVPAAHGNGTHSHAEERIHPQPARNAHRNQVLRHNQHGHQADHHQQRASALAEYAHIGLETHGGEKEHHAQVFHRSVKGTGKSENRISEKGQERYQQTAGNGCRNAEPLQKGNLTR